MSDTRAAASLLDHLLEPLSPLLVGAEDIAINRPGQAWVCRAGSWSPVDVPYSLEDLWEIAILASKLSSQFVSADDPLCGTELPRGERLQVCVDPTVPADTISLTLRKPDKTLFPLSAIHQRYRSTNWNRWSKETDEKDFGHLTDLYDRGDIEEFLAEAVAARLNIVLAGSTAASKTSLSKMICTQIHPRERLITIEAAREMELAQPNVVRLTYQDSGSVTPADLLKATLWMRPDRVMLPELRDSHAGWVFIHDTISGHPGSVTGIHAQSASGAVKRLYALVSGAPEAPRDKETILALLGAAVDLIVPLARSGVDFNIRSTWFKGDAIRRGETLADLLRD